MKLFHFVVVSLAFIAAIALSSSPWRGMLCFPFGLYCGRALNDWRPRR